jgi:hypothetical protein
MTTLGLLLAASVIAIGFRLLTARVPDVFVSRASLPMPTHTQIICSNCSGDDLLPRKTRLALLGREACCENCGSTSYALAASLGPVLAQRLRREREVKEYCDVSIQVSPAPETLSTEERVSTQAPALAPGAGDGFRRQH